MFLLCQFFLKQQSASHFTQLIQELNPSFLRYCFYFYQLQPRQQVNECANDCDAYKKQEFSVKYQKNIEAKRVRSESKLNLNMQIQKRASILHHLFNNEHNIYYKLLILNNISIIIAQMIQGIISCSPPALLLEPIFQKPSLLQEIASYFTKLFVPDQGFKMSKLLFTIGIASLTYSIGKFAYQQWKFWQWLPAYINRRKQEQFSQFRKRYGRCYVLITGAADGIGYAFARQWAKLGFDLLLVDIQKDKLLFRTRQILETFKDIQVEPFVVDMSNSGQIKQFLTQIQRYEVGVLINNVGLTGGGPYLQIQPQTIFKTLTVNYTPMYLLTQHFLPKMRLRANRSAIINLSSATGVYFSHNVGAYSSIKHAVDIYSRTLSLENRDKIDVLSARPFGVSTGMMKMRKQQRIITPKKCVESILSELGTADSCFSGKQHKIMASFFGSLSEEERLKVYGAAWDKNRKLKQ